MGTPLFGTPQGKAPGFFSLSFTPGGFPTPTFSLTFWFLPQTPPYFHFNGTVLVNPPLNLLAERGTGNTLNPFTHGGVTLKPFYPSKRQRAPNPHSQKNRGFGFFQGFLHIPGKGPFFFKRVFLLLSLTSSFFRGVWVKNPPILFILSL